MRGCSMSTKAFSAIAWRARAAALNVRGEVEFGVDARDLRAASGDDAWEASLAVTSDDYVVTYRLPDSFDLAAIARLSDVAEARRRLLNAAS